MKHKSFLERYRKLCIGEPSKSRIVSKDFDERYNGLIVKRNEYTYLVKVFNCWYDFPKMLVPYIFYKMTMGFCIYDFCCCSNIIEHPGEYYRRNYIKSSIVVNENEYIHKSTFHLGYAKCFNNLSIKNAIPFGEHSNWMIISSVTPYCIPCLREKVKEFNLEWFVILRATNNKFLRRNILERFTCDKCYQYFDSFMNYLFSYDKAKVKLDSAGYLENIADILDNKILDFNFGTVSQMKVDRMKFVHLKHEIYEVYHK